MRAQIGISMASFRDSFFARPACAFGVLAAALIGLAASTSLAAAQDPIDEVLQNGSAEWSDTFDAASVGAADVRTSIPTLSPEILAPMQAAIAQ